MFEDPVTGSAHGPLGVYLVLNGIIRLGERGHTSFVAEQGDFLGRPGRMTVKISTSPNAELSASISARAVTVLKGEMVLP